MTDDVRRDPRTQTEWVALPGAGPIVRIISGAVVATVSRNTWDSWAEKGPKR